MPSAGRVPVSIGEERSYIPAFEDISSITGSSVNITAYSDESEYFENLITAFPFAAVLLEMYSASPVFLFRL